MPPTRTPIPPPISLPESGPMAPSVTPMPPGVLALPDVSWAGGFTGLGNPAEWRTRPNAVDIYNQPVYIPPDYAASLGYSPGSMVWKQVGDTWSPFGPLPEWEAMSPEDQAAQRWYAESGNQISSSAFEGIGNAPTPERIQANVAALQPYAEQFGWDDNTLQRIAVAEAFGEGSLLKAALQGPVGMTEQDAMRWQWEQQDRQQAQLDRVAEAEYRQQALAQQAQQAAAAAAAQRRAQAMALAESILGMQQQQWAQVSGWALPPGSQTAPGWEQGGAVSQMFARQGLPYTPIQAVQTPGVDYAPAYQWAQKLLGGS